MTAVTPQEIAHLDQSAADLNLSLRHLRAEIVEHGVQRTILALAGRMRRQTGLCMCSTAAGLVRLAQTSATMPDPLPADYIRDRATLDLHLAHLPTVLDQVNGETQRNGLNASIRALSTSLADMTWYDLHQIGVAATLHIAEGWVPASADNGGEVGDEIWLDQDNGLHLVDPGSWLAETAAYMGWVRLHRPGWRAS